MSNKEMMRVLQEIKDYCKGRGPMCDKCRFHSNEGCIINNVPDKWQIYKLRNINVRTWNKLYAWLVDVRAASFPDANKSLKEFTIDQARVRLLDNILEYMNELVEEEHDEA